MHGRAFQTLGQAFQTLSQGFSFLLSSQKFGQVFQKLSWAFQRLGHMFWNKCSTESFDQWTYWEFLIIWSVKNSLHTSNKSLIRTCYKDSNICFQFWNFLFSLNFFLFSLPFFFFRYWLLNQVLDIFHK